MTEKSLLIQLINDAILKAVEHGGDTGGAYYSNLSRQEQSVTIIANVLGCGIKLEKGPVWLLKE